MSQWGETSVGKIQLAIQFIYIYIYILKGIDQQRDFYVFYFFKILSLYDRNKSYKSVSELFYLLFCQYKFTRITICLAQLAWAVEYTDCTFVEE